MGNQLPAAVLEDPHVDEAQVRGSCTAALLAGFHLRGCGQDGGIAVQPDVHGFVIQLVILPCARLQIVDVRSLIVGVTVRMRVCQIIGQHLSQLSFIAGHRRRGP